MLNSQALAEEILFLLKATLGEHAEFVPLHAPEFRGKEEELVVDCIRTGWVSSVGKYVEQFEQELALACGTDHAVAVVNGTAALELALRVVGVRPNDEVLMPSLTFIATANAAHHLGAVPHFVDVDPARLGLDPIALRAHLACIAESRGGALYNRETGRRFGALVPMHAFGHPADMDALAKVAAEFQLPVVEDAAEALGSRYRNRPCGSFGRVGALSFNGNKILTTGGGGAIVTNDHGLASRAKHLATTAKLPHPWKFHHDEIGYNYRLPNINAALGVAQLAQLEERVAQKRALAQTYLRAFDDHPHIEVMCEPADSRSNYWLNTLVLAPHAGSARRTILEVLNAGGLMARPAWEPLHTLPVYAGAPRTTMQATEALAASIVNIPSSAHLGARVR